MKPDSKVRFICPHCHAALRVPRTLAGKAGKCPICHQKISADGANRPAVPPPLPAPTKQQLRPHQPQASDDDVDPGVSEQLATVARKEGIKMRVLFACVGLILGALLSLPLLLLAGYFLDLDKVQSDTQDRDLLLFACVGLIMLPLMVLGVLAGVYLGGVIANRTPRGMAEEVEPRVATPLSDDTRDDPEKVPATQALPRERVLYSTWLFSLVLVRGIKGLKGCWMAIMPVACAVILWARQGTHPPGWVQIFIGLGILLGLVWGLVLGTAVFVGVVLSFYTRLEITTGRTIYQDYSGTEVIPHSELGEITAVFPHSELETWKGIELTINRINPTGTPIVIHLFDHLDGKLVTDLLASLKDKFSDAAVDPDELQ